ncbi:uncharacterized protein EV154DRAFT_482166 [Mucor mucedo]|uniref:uncharacterized protein n=1 Tax=Mucor mucedo TaxID=29922 RepID=UPI00221FD207|nr:uncharacterized protein EV154DRAFT_482166 [Mucor mucedo]KAI7890442.1 hypothetical protein EV154DRAFT_482166 [Mucor mucedo]
MTVTISYIIGRNGHASPKILQSSQFNDFACVFKWGIYLSSKKIDLSKTKKLHKSLGHITNFLVQCVEFDSYKHTHAYRCHPPSNSHAQSFVVNVSLAALGESYSDMTQLQISGLSMIVLTHFDHKKLMIVGQQPA